MALPQPWLTGAGGLALWSAALYWVNSAVPEEYMDEPFHVAQTQHYCARRWTHWTPGLTTFPGLFLLGSSLGLCELHALRALNGMFFVASLVAMTVIFRRRKLRASAALLHAASLSLYPPHFFYHILYYTDPGATCAVLWLLWAVLARRPGLAGLLGTVAIAFRQNNVVWVAFALGAGALMELKSHPQHRKLFPGQATSRGEVERLGEVVAAAWDMRFFLLRRLWPLLVPLAAFAVFLYANGGAVVIGDRSHHEPVPHLAMLGYAAALLWVPFGVAGTWGVASRETRQELVVLLCHSRRLLLGLGTGALLMVYFTYGHPFLRSDNRHLTFYLWRHVLGRPLLRACLAPGFVLAGILAFRRLRRAQSLAFALGFFASVALVVVPAQLLELRYFNLPVLVYHLFGPRRPYSAVRGSLALHGFLSAALFFVFLCRPFVDSDGETQRFLL